MIVLTLSEIAIPLKGVLLGQDVTFSGCSTDSRTLAPGALYVALKGKKFDGHDFVLTAQQQGAAAVMVEKPISCGLPTLRVESTYKALGALAQFWRQRFSLPIVAVTGSNGKTTVKEMVQCIFSCQGNVLATQGNLNNDIGVPLTLFNLNTTHQCAVIEMGANHPGEIAYLTHIAQPTAAVITQCAPAHLEGFKDVDGVAQAKGEIFSGLPSHGTAVINQDDVYANLWRTLAASRRILSFGLRNVADVTATNITLQPTHSDFTLKTINGDVSIHLSLPGRHNIMNALAATSCALACGCDLTVIQRGLQMVKSVKGRLQRHLGMKNCIVIDDTYNANPGSLHVALNVLNSYPAPRWLVLGDMNELGPRSAVFHEQAGRLARELGVERLWTVGNMSRHATDSFGNGALHFSNHADLVQALCADLPEGMTLLIKGSRGMQMEKVVHALMENQ